MYELLIRLYYELEIEIRQLKSTWNGIVEANINLVDENKYLKGIIKELNDYIDRVEFFASVDHVNIFSLNEFKKILRGDKE